jgi:hypothetical protein
MSLSQNFPTVRPSLLLDFAAAGRLDPRITFARNSPAVYYDGVTQTLAEQNLFLQSQNFTTTWIKGGATVTPAAGVAPDETTTAQKIVATSTTPSSYHTMYQQVSTITGSYTFSIYAKSAEYTKVYLSDPNTTRFFAAIDLTAGSVISSGGPFLVLATATLDAATGWVRCVIQLSVTSASIFCSAVGYPDAGATLTAFGAIYTGNDVSGVLLWGAQLEQRNVVTAYTVTTTQPITNYIPVLLTAAANTARFDYNPTTSVALGLLIEEARTNLVVRSEEFDNAIWVKINNMTVSANVTIAPDGTLSADKLIPDAVNTVTHYIYQVYTVTGLYTWSVYAKAAEYSCLFVTNVPNGRIYFDLTNGTVSELTTGWASASATPVGNGWYRCSVTSNVSQNGGNWYVGAFPSYATRAVSYAGNNFNGIYAWGAQLEAGTFATSYIATVATTQTRQADSAVMTGTNFSIWYNSGEGALYQNFTALGVSATDRVSLRISDTTGPFVNDITFRNFSGTEVFAVHVGGLPAQASLAGPFAVTAGSVNRVAAVYKTNDFAFSMNNATATTDSSGSIPTVSQLSFPSSGCNYIRKIAYYPVRLTNTQLQTLTQN